jgi:multisubunit Na+/H+ antiporter MnhC subunit
MTWQLGLSLALTIPAVVIGFGACAFFLLRRMRIAKHLRSKVKNHSRFCQCRWCNYMHED